MRSLFPLTLIVVLPLASQAQNSAPAGATISQNPTLLSVEPPTAVVGDQKIVSPEPAPSDSTPQALRSAESAAAVPGSADYSDLLTFDEFPPGTAVENNYVQHGIIFGGSGPKLVTDNSSAYGAVLSGTPTLEGDIEGTFVLPGTNTPASVFRMAFDIGSIDGDQSVQIDFFNLNGDLLYSVVPTQQGFLRYSFTGGNQGIARWRAYIIGDEPAGFGIDNLYFSIPGEEDDLDREKGEVCFSEGNPINPAVGNKVQMETDYEGTRPFPLSVTRTYNSLDGSWQRFRQLNFDPGSVDARLVRADGKGVTFLGIPSANTLVASARDITGSLTRTQDSATILGWQYANLDDDVEVYDAEGRIVSVTKRSGVSHTYTYTESSITVTHSLGGSLTYALDLNGRITGFTDPDGYTYSYDYNANGMLTGVNYPGDTGGRIYHYEDLAYPDLLSGISDANGNRFASWSYDSNRRAVSSEHAGQTDRVSFDYTYVNYPSTPFVTTTNALGKSRTYYYTRVNGVRKPYYIDGLPSANCAAAFQRIGYNSSGFISSRQDWEGNTTTFTRDSQGRELIRTEAQGTPQERETRTEWHPTFNVPAKITEPGMETTFTYDGNGNELSRRVRDTTTP